VHATNGVLVRSASSNDVVNEVTVAVQACFLQNVRIMRLDENGFVKILEREAFGVVITVDSLGHELLDQRMRKVAIRAGGNDVMTRFHPRIVLVVHHMAVRACLRIGREIGKTFGVNEREQPQAEKCAKARSGYKEELRGHSHDEFPTEVFVFWGF
jgi:hypothetical protein